MMRYLSQTDRSQLAGEYFAPEGLYDYIKQLPFTGRVRSDKKTLVAGEWTEIALDYEVGGSGLADGAWIKGTFKFYSVSVHGESRSTYAVIFHDWTDFDI